MQHLTDKRTTHRDLTKLIYPDPSALLTPLPPAPLTFSTVSISPVRLVRSLAGMELRMVPRRRLPAALPPPPAGPPADREFRVADLGWAGACGDHSRGICRRGVHSQCDVQDLRGANCPEPSYLKHF